MKLSKFVMNLLNVNLEMAGGTCLFKILSRERTQKGLRTSGSGIQEAQFEHGREHSLTNPFSVKGVAPSTSG